jgi:glutamine amidotransferase
MCRLLGIVSIEPIPYRILLREKENSLAKISLEHPDGWGLAVYSSGKKAQSETHSGWDIEKGILCAHHDQKFHELASQISGEVLISHVRKKTVGPTNMENTHPFSHEGWVFAHNGSILDLDFLKQHTSEQRLQEVKGTTDTELFFAFLLTTMDQAGLIEKFSIEKMDQVLKHVMDEIYDRSKFGTMNFLLSNGEVLYALRFHENPLFVLERGPHLGNPHRMSSQEDGTVIEGAWKKRKRSIFIASEKMTPEPWRPIENKALLRVDRLPKPKFKIL